VVQLKILVSTKTTVDGETSVDYSSKLEMPPSAGFDVYVDNGGLVISALNEVSEGKKKTKRDISVEITFDRALSKKIAEACKNLPVLPK
jgi:hypothetical protein